MKDLAKLDRALCCLTATEREVVEMYFGFSGRRERDVLEIASYYGWSVDSVKLKGRGALKKLRLKSYGLRDEFSEYFPKKF